jgi:CO/xanthine dehydrogenase Mo-binding subunit/aerobic-type carbon monoxide dehydrogenase small subunit (CoxS/CutS family)
MEISFILNHQPVMVNVDPGRNLLGVLRDDLGLTGTKQGCDFEGECGACTVLLDGLPVRACLTPVGKVSGRHVLTVEGLGAPGALHPLQQAFIDVGAVQCGYCTPGMLLAAKALLDRRPDPSRAEIVEALEGNLCRCTGYTRIVMAVELAAARMRREDLALSDLTDRAPIGGDTRRVDALAKVTGQAKYAEDIVLPDMLYGRVVRSPHHHARLLALNTTPAAHAPGVVRVLTAEDVPGENGFPGYSRFEPVLPKLGETLKMVGAPVALVVAETPAAAEAGAAAVEVAYEVLPHTFDVEAALGKDAVPIYADGNVLNTHRVARGDLDAAFAAAEVILETRYLTAFQEHAALEREAALSYFDAAGRLTVVGGTHEPHWHQEWIAAALGLPKAQVRFVMPPTGGSFGGKQDPWPLIAVALMAYHTQKPVRLAYSRRESFDASPKRHPYDVRYKIGSSRAGQLTGVHVRIAANTGGYDAHGFYLPDYAVMASCGPYKWSAVDAQAQSVFTNGPKSGQFRGFGAPQANFALECALDELIETLGVDPIEFRLQNAIDQSSDSFLGYPVFETWGYAQVLEALRPHYREQCERAAAFNAAGDGEWRTGVGLAGLWHRFGKSGSLRVEAHAELAPDGRFVIYCAAPDYGQGANTTMTQLAAETLGVPREQVELVNADTARTPDSGIQGASRTTYWVGSAVCSAAHHLKQEILATAAELLDHPPADLRFTQEGSVSRSDNEQAVTLAQVAQEFDRMGKSRRVVGAFDPSALFPPHTRPEYTPHFTSGADMAQVAVNVRTGEVRVERVVAAHDVGRAINPVDAKGQVEGAILMGIGTALLEEYIPGVSAGLSDYYLPTVKSTPEIEVLLVELPSRYGPFGAKGLAEPALMPVPPAIVNAISRAIGARVRQLPATPERVLAALRRRRTKDERRMTEDERRSAGDK